MISVKATRLMTQANTSEIAHDRKTKMTLRRTLRVDLMSRVGMDTPLLFSKVTKNYAFRTKKGSRKVRKGASLSRKVREEIGLATLRTKKGSRKVRKKLTWRPLREKTLATFA